MRALLRSMAPDSFEDISAVLALYRPGPMGANAHNDYADRKNGRKPVAPIHPELAEPLAEILGETYGLIVYQEQVMAIAQKLAGYSLGEADLLRRAMGKKKKEILDKEYVPFSDGHARPTATPTAAIKTLWDILVPFSDYAFNKAHTAGYGLVSYWTAYLKANYPAEYMAALLTSVGDDKDKSAVYLAECRRMGIKVLPPDVNESSARLRRRSAPTSGSGSPAIRNVGANVVDVDRRARREDKGAFADFSDFLRKVDAVVCNKKVVESLIKAGAFDSLGHTRKGLLAVHADAIDAVLDVKRKARRSASSTCSAADRRRRRRGRTTVTPADARPTEWDKSDLLAFEREMLGPLRLRPPAARRRARARRPHADMPIVGAAGRGHGRRRRRWSRSAGILTGVQRRVTKQGEPWASAHARGPRRRGRGAVLPAAPTQLVGAVRRRGRDRGGQGPGRPARRRSRG